MTGAKLQHGPCEDRDKSSTGKQAITKWDRMGQYSGARDFESAGVEGVNYERTWHAVRGNNDPGFIY
jgi:hypothetical protein